MTLAASSGPLSQPSRLRAWFRGLSAATALSVFALIVLGGVVRVTGSGLGCPDWPLCHGRFLPPLELEAVIEYSHRLVASALVGPLVLATCVVAWSGYRRERWVLVPATVALVMMLAQALLGGVTVLNELPGSVVAAHLALGEALLACVTLLVVVAMRGPLRFSKEDLQGPRLAARAARFPLLVLISGFGLYVLLLTGSYVTLSGATVACLDWPLCRGNTLPASTLPMIHMLHRVVSVVVGILLLYSLHLGFRDRRNSVVVRVFSLAVAAFFLAQIVVGAVAVWLRFPVELRALHLALATLVWGTMVALASLVFIRPDSPAVGGARA